MTRAGLHGFEMTWQWAIRQILSRNLAWLHAIMIGLDNILMSTKLNNPDDREKLSSWTRYDREEKAGHSMEHA